MNRREFIKSLMLFLTMLALNFKKLFEVSAAKEESNTLTYPVTFPIIFTKRTHKIQNNHRQHKQYIPVIKC